MFVERVFVRTGSVGSLPDTPSFPVGIYQKPKAYWSMETNNPRSAQLTACQYRRKRGLFTSSLLRYVPYSFNNQ